MREAVLRKGKMTRGKEFIVSFADDIKPSVY